MLLIKVTVYPPGYDDSFDPNEEDRVRTVRPRSAWTAVHLPPEEDDSR